MSDLQVVILFAVGVVLIGAVAAIAYRWWSSDHGQ